MNTIDPRECTTAIFTPVFGDWHNSSRCVADDCMQKHIHSLHTLSLCMLASMKAQLESLFTPGLCCEGQVTYFPNITL